MGVLGIALATVILPRLADQHATQSRQLFAATLDWSLRCTVVVGVPAAVGLAVLAEPLMATLFHRGEFSARDVAMSASSLRAYAPGLLGFILVKVLAPGFYARQNIRTPVKVALATLAVTQATNVALVPWLGHAGLAAALPQRDGARGGLRQLARASRQRAGGAQQARAGQPEARIYVAFFEGLTEYDPKTAQAVPALAERWDGVKVNGCSTALSIAIRGLPASLNLAWTTWPSGPGYSGP